MDIAWREKGVQRMCVLEDLGAFLSWGRNTSYTLVHESLCKQLGVKHSRDR